MVHVQSEDGTPLMTLIAGKDFQSLVFSSPDLVAGSTVNVYTGGSVEGTSVGGLYIDGTYAGGTEVGSVTVG